MADWSENSGNIVVTLKFWLHAKSCRTHPKWYTSERERERGVRVRAGRDDPRDRRGNKIDDFLKLLRVVIPIWSSMTHEIHNVFHTTLIYLIPTLPITYLSVSSFIFMRAIYWWIRFIGYLLLSFILFYLLGLWVFFPGGIIRRPAPTDWTSIELRLVYVTLLKKKKLTAFMRDKSPTVEEIWCRPSPPTFPRDWWLWHRNLLSSHDVGGDVASSFQDDAIGGPQWSLEGSTSVPIKRRLKSTHLFEGNNAYILSYNDGAGYGLAAMVLVLFD